MASHWYYSKGIEKYGPIAGAKLKQLAASGEIEADDLVWKTGMRDWKPAGSIKGLLPPSKAMAPAPAPIGSHAGTQPHTKKNGNEDGNQVSGASPPPFALNEFNLNSLVGATRKLFRETWDKVRQVEVKNIPKKHVLFGCVGLAGLGTGLAVCLLLAVAFFGWFLTSSSAPGIPDEFGDSAVYKITWEPYTTGDGDWYDRITAQYIDYMSPDQSLAVRFHRIVAFQRGKRATGRSVTPRRNWEKKVYDGHKEELLGTFDALFSNRKEGNESFECTLRSISDNGVSSHEITVAKSKAEWIYHYSVFGYNGRTNFSDNKGNVEKVR